MATKYEKVENIGNGAFGSAWLVLRRHTNRKYVLKEVPVLGMSEKSKKQALTEVKALSRCRHVNVIRYREAFVDNTALCIVMEYADGGDLHQKIKANQGVPFDPDMILDWIIQICFALRNIHSLNIIHRDLKTQNIFVMSSGVLKVGDLGIARILNVNEDHAITAIGTPYYLSPEICNKQPYDYKTDMWAAGCVLYELCTFRHPFQGSSFASLLLKITKGAYTAINKSYGPVLEDLISVLLNTVPDKRPSAEQVLCVPSLQTHIKAYVNNTKLIRESHIPPSPCTPKDVENSKHENIIKSHHQRRSLSTPRAVSKFSHGKRARSVHAEPESIQQRLRFASPKLSLYKEVLKKRKPLASLDNSPDLVLPQCRGSQSRSVSGRPHHSVAKPEIATDILYEPPLHVQVGQLLHAFCTDTDTTTGKQDVIRHFLQKQLGTDQFQAKYNEINQYLKNISADKTTAVCLPLILQLLKWEYCTSYQVKE